MLMVRMFRAPRQIYQNINSKNWKVWGYSLMGKHILKDEDLGSNPNSSTVAVA